MTQGRHELLGYLERHVQRARRAGVTLRVVEVGEADWLAMGRPELAAGVRVRPARVPPGRRRAVS